MKRDNLSIEVVNQKIEIPLRFVEMKLITKRMGDDRIIGPELIIKAIGMNKKELNKWAGNIFKIRKRRGE